MSCILNVTQEEVHLGIVALSELGESLRFEHDDSSDNILPEPDPRWQVIIHLFSQNLRIEGNHSSHVLLSMDARDVVLRDIRDDILKTSKLTRFPDYTFVLFFALDFFSSSLTLMERYSGDEVDFVVLLANLSNLLPRVQQMFIQLTIVLILLNKEFNGLIIEDILKLRRLHLLGPVDLLDGWILQLQTSDLVVNFGQSRARVL